MTDVPRTPRWLAALTGLVLLVLIASAGFAVIIGFQNFARIGV
jgi:hypothetical protein